MKKAKLIKLVIIVVSLLVAFLFVRTAPGADLLIITPGEFVSALQPMVDHKNATEMPTLMTTLEEIYGNLLFRGVDEPEEIKRAIAYYEENHDIKYVMLVGDVDKFPVRWVTQEAANDPGTLIQYFPSDLYYADLYDSMRWLSSWDSDGDGYFGEHLISDRCKDDPYSVNADHADLHPDVAVGRVPASSEEEVDSYVAKVIRYEYLTYADEPASDWFHNVLLIAGNSWKCGPGIHFNDIQTYLGDDFMFRTYIDNGFYGESETRPCDCRPGEPHDDCLTRTGLNTEEEIDIFKNAERWPDDFDSSEYHSIGFLGWHDHTWGGRKPDYTQADNKNVNKYTIVFSDGCGDGMFAGRPIPNGRFMNDNLPYNEVGGRILEIIYTPFMENRDGIGGDETYYDLSCEIDGIPHSMDHLAGIFPDIIFQDDVGRVDAGRVSWYIRNLPPPMPLQECCDWDIRFETRRMFAKCDKEETGWIGLVAANTGVIFPLNGELESLFFGSYAYPHLSVEGRNRMGDMWHSMVEYWLEQLFHSNENFNLTGHFDKYNFESYWYDDDYSYCKYCERGIRHTMMYALFGDPSLRVGGVEGLKDEVPPTTTDDTDVNWHSEDVTVTLTATDEGSPPLNIPSGVRETRYRVDGGVEERGRHITVEVLPGHAGTHSIEYYSVDFVENAEDPHTREVNIDAVPPFTEVQFDGEQQATAVPCICPLDECAYCPDIGCYNGSVTIELNVTDEHSGVAFTNYYLHGESLPVCVYGFCTSSGPYPIRFDAGGGTHTLIYWSQDNAGNIEDHREVTFCVNPDWETGIMRARARNLLALKEIVAFRMRKAFKDTLPPIKEVHYEFAYQEPEKWMAIGVDYSGGYEVVLWDTTKLIDGDYYIKMTAIGSGGFNQQSNVSQAQQQGEVIYQEQLKVKICNIPDSSYEFTLQAPEEIARGEVIEYKLEFENKMDYSLTNLLMTCDLDTGFYDKIEVLDEGQLNEDGLPSWFRKEVKSGETWKVHFNGVTKTYIDPRMVITSQALITTDTVPLLLSDDPHTEEEGDYTEVAIKPLKGTIKGKVEDDNYGTPLSALVAIEGPIAQSAATDGEGHYSFVGLSPGTYTVSVDVKNYDYHIPVGPLTVVLDGTGGSVQVNFFMNHTDIIPPVSSISLSADEIVQENMTEISGTAYDYHPGSGVSKVELSIVCYNDRKYWNGYIWEDNETWLLASGTTEWALDCSGISWGGKLSYAIKSRATDNVGNVEKPIAIITTSDLPAPTLISPLNKTSVYHIPTFEWSHVADSYYGIQIDNNNDFLSPEIYESYLTSNTYVPWEIEEGTYYWRVKATDKERGYPESDWSEVWKVILLPIPCSAKKIYGEESEEVELMRYLRDTVLSKTPEGREIIKLYYQWSPAIIRAMEQDEEFSERVKEMMDGILVFVGGDVESMGETQPALSTVYKETLLPPLH